MTFRAGSSAARPAPAHAEIANLVGFRAVDAVETAEAWDCALRAETDPSLLCLSRQALTTYRDVDDDVNWVSMLEPEAGGDVTLVVTGSDVAMALNEVPLGARQRRCGRGFGAILRSFRSAIA